MDKKLNLTEATLLALQGKLPLTENIDKHFTDTETCDKDIKEESLEIETDTTEVKIDDDNTTIDTPEATVTVQSKSCDCANCDKHNEDEVESDIDTETVEDTDEVITESVAELKYDTFEDFKNSVKTSGGLYGLVANNYTNIPQEIYKEIALNAIYELNNDDKIIEDIHERVYDNLDESKNMTKKCDEDTECNKAKTNVNIQSFENKLTEYYKNKNKDIDKVKVNKMLKNNKAMKIECTITDTTGKKLNETLMLSKLVCGKYFTKYSVKNTNKITESKNNNTFDLITFESKNNGKTLYCANIK